MMWLKVLLVGAAGAAMVAGPPRGRVPEELKPGDPAPEFSLPGTDGKTHTLSEYRGHTVVLAWYPKAFTGG